MLRCFSNFNWKRAFFTSSSRVDLIPLARNLTITIIQNPILLWNEERKESGTRMYDDDYDELMIMIMVVLMIMMMKTMLMKMMVMMMIMLN